MRVRYLPCLLLLAACPGPSAPAGVSNVGPVVGAGAYAIAPHYAALFEDGRSWTYQVVDSSVYYDPSDPAANENGNVVTTTERTATCRVVETGVLPDGRISRIACEGLQSDMGVDPISGTWATDPRGVWKLKEDVPAGTVPALPAEDLWMSSAPAPDRKETVDPEFGPDPVGAVEIAQDGDAWCRNEYYMAGDESWISVCVTSEGIVKGSFGWAGGTVNESAFTLVR